MEKLLSWRSSTNPLLKYLYFIRYTLKTWAWKGQCNSRLWRVSDLVILIRRVTNDQCWNVMKVTNLTSLVSPAVRQGVPCTVFWHKDGGKQFFAIFEYLWKSYHWTTVSWASQETANNSLYYRLIHLSILWNSPTPLSSCYSAGTNVIVRV